VVLARIAGPKNKGTMLSMNNVVHYAGAIVSPTIAGILTDWLNWRIPFVIFAVMISVAMIILMFTFRQQNPEILIIKDAEHKKVSTVLEKKFITEAVKFIPVFIIGIFAFFYRGSFQHTLIPFYGNDVFHVGVEALGFYISMASVVATVSIFMFGMMSDRYGRKAVLIPALLSSMLAVLALLLPEEVNPLMIACILQGTGAVISSMPNILISDLAPPGSVGKIMGANRVFADSGYFFGTVITGAILDHFGFRSPLFVIVGVAVMTIVVTVLYVHNKPSEVMMSRK
jgi:MFS family permease